tara:strand:- start:6443 stop:6583 length:141 start_codon:yes stop_codon:yes gene_type:complete
MVSAAVKSIIIDGEYATRELALICSIPILLPFKNQLTPALSHVVSQ